jgi:hypothetical protein
MPTPDDVSANRRRRRWARILGKIAAASNDLGERIAIDQGRAMASPPSSTLPTAQLEAAWEDMAAEIESRPSDQRTGDTD